MSRVEPGSDASAPQRFDVVYRTHFDPLLAYAIRRTDQPADAADVIAETFLVAWRRQAEMPGGEETRLWLFGVARKVLANARRGSGRRDRLGERLRRSLSVLPEPDPTGAASTRLTVRAAMDRLGDLDREVLALALWEELTPAEIARVIGVAPGAVRTRLSRARVRLSELLGDTWTPAGHEPSVWPEPVREEER